MSEVHDIVTATMEKVNAYLAQLRDLGHPANKAKIILKTILKRFRRYEVVQEE